MERWLEKLKKHPIIAISLLIAGVIGGVAQFGKNLKDVVTLVTEVVVGKPLDVNELAKNLGDASIQVRTSAALDFRKLSKATAPDLKKAVSILETFLNQRAVKEAALLSGPEQDIVIALETLGVLLRAADERRTDVKRPQLIGLRLDSLMTEQLYLRGATLIGCSFEDSRLTNADLAQSTLVDVRFARARALNMYLLGSKIRASCFEGAALDNSNLSNAVISSSDFRSASLRNADLTGAKFENTNLASSDLEGSQLVRADLSSAFGIFGPQLSKVRNSEGLKLAHSSPHQPTFTVCHPR